MSKLQEYLKRKRIKELGLPQIWVVESTPDGVERPIAVQVIETPHEWANYIRYKLDGSPFEVDIEKGSSSRKREDWGTGFGVWARTEFCSLSEEEANDYFEKESFRFNQNTFWK